MKFAQPESHDFTFASGNFNYAIGYQDDEFKNIAMSTSSKDGSQWSFVANHQLYDKTMSEWGGAVGFLTYFLKKCNDKLSESEDLPPPIPVDEFEKLLHIITHGLKFENNKITQT